VPITRVSACNYYITIYFLLLSFSYLFFLCVSAIKDLLPGILKQLGPKQMGFIQDYVNTLKQTEKPAKETAPDLVEDFEEVSKQN